MSFVNPVEGEAKFGDVDFYVLGVQFPIIEDLSECDVREL